MFQLNAPKQITWIISLLLGLVGVILFLVADFAWDFWLVIVGFVLLLAATVLPDL